MSYWNLEFSAMWLSVLGVDFVFSAGSLFIAKFALPYEQSMAGALLTAMTQVCFFFFLLFQGDDNLNNMLIWIIVFFFGSLALHLG